MSTQSIVITAVAQHFGVTPGEMVSRHRAAPISLARQAAMYILRADRGWSFPRIARALHRRDHTTAMHGIDRITHQLGRDPDLCQRVAAARADAKAGMARFRQQQGVM